MIFSLIFILWTAVLIAAWTLPRGLSLATFALAWILSIALFKHHVTDPLTLSF